MDKGHCFDLAHGQTGEDVIRQVRRRLGHTSGVTSGAHSTALAGEGDEVVTAIVATGAGKAVGKDAAFEVFAKRLLDKGRWCVVVALPVELTGACYLEPGFKVLGDGAVQQGSLGVARVVALGFGRRGRAMPSVRGRNARRSGCGGGHGPFSGSLWERLFA